MHETRQRTESLGVTALELAQELAAQYHIPPITRYFNTTADGLLTTAEACSKLDQALTGYYLTPCITWPETDRKAVLPHFQVTIPPDFNIMACLLIVASWQHDTLITNAKLFVTQHHRQIAHWYLDYDLIGWKFTVNAREAKKMIQYHAKEDTAA